MTWIKIDDKLTSHPKWVGLTLEAKSLWFHAAVWCGAHNNDGLLPGDALPLIAFTASVPTHVVEDATSRLVRSTLWARKPKSAGGGFEITDWLEYQPSRQQVKDRAVAQELSAEIEMLHDWLHKKAVGKKVKALINTRDGGWCRYCGELTTVTIGDRRSPHRKTYDLIDPAARWDTDASALNAAEMSAIAELWAIACGWCNSIKGRRTPDEAGMMLHEPPSTRRGVLPHSASTGSRAVPEVGTGLPGSDQVGTATGLNGSEPGRVGSRSAVPDGGSR